MISENKIQPDENVIIKSPARIRLEREMNDLHLPSNVEILEISYAEMTVKVRLFPDEGPFSGAQIDFLLSIPAAYPHGPPKAKILSKVFHPNFDYEGHVCLNILRLDWTPVLSLSVIFFGLLSVLLAPDGEEPLNQDAGKLIEDDPDEYFRIARRCAFGGQYNGVQFDQIMT